MEYRLLGRTGVRGSPLCRGARNCGEPTPEPERGYVAYHSNPRPEEGSATAPVSTPT